MLWVQGFGPQKSHMRVGRQLHSTAFAQGLFGKSKVALFGQLDQQRVICHMALDNYFAWLLGASGASGHLDDQLGHALAGTKVGREQAAIGIQDRNQRYLRKVVPLASIWVPTRMHGSPRWMIFSMASSEPLRAVLSRSMRTTGTFGNSSCKRSSARSVPAPTGCNCRLWHLGQACGRCSICPQ